MGWETRSRGTSYYTRSRRVDGRVVREYVGAGLVGELAARMDEIERSQRLDAAQASRDERKRLDTADRMLAALCNATDLQVCQALFAAGYHQHHRGEWRKRRAAKVN